MSPERSLEEIIQERAFAGLLQTQAQPFFQLCNSIGRQPCGSWGKKHFHQLVSAADSLESFLDDFGARFNRTYAALREFVASLRWFGMSGFSLAHLEGRLSSYDLEASMSSSAIDEARASIRGARDFIDETVQALIGQIVRECDELGLERTPELYPDQHIEPLAPRQRLPRNVGQEDLVDENQKIAEVASKYLASCDMLDELGVQPLSDPARRNELLARCCSEARARVYEATVHNLQSTYDTNIKNSVVEGRDSRLPRLRGHLSTALHLLEAVTFLTHFVERHEGGQRNEDVERRITRVVLRARVEGVILNNLLTEAVRFMSSGRSVAEELLQAYTNLQELVVDLPDDLKLHARPASLIVGIVGHYGTPVELELAGQRCNAGSILELLVAVGSNPEANRYVFRGDENPLRDIGLLFQSGLGERGMDALPEQLGYLRS
ncbi:MAG TPA: HPr family phosphocarrier protein [Planctomycetota bacterium]|nr:HPr family phosphocarrier protein [Planctomycetota bacterium]